MQKDISRRSFVKNTSIVGLGIPLYKRVWKPKSILTLQENSIPLKWLDDNKESINGTTWGTPWAKGVLKNVEDVVLKDTSNNELSLQSWPLSYWGDGSIKWSAHAVGKIDSPQSDYKLEIGKNKYASNTSRISVREDEQKIYIDTNAIQATFLKTGNVLIESLLQNGKAIATNGRLELKNKEEENKIFYQGKIENIIVEQKGSERVVIKIEGKHANGNRAWLPFVLRFYFYRESNAVRILHTIIFDGDEQHDFINGLGFTIDVPLHEEHFNRHIRFVDANDKGVFAEAVQGLTGLRRNPGDTIKTLQLQGKFIDKNNIDEAVLKNLQYVPKFGDYSLSQLHPDGYTIRKRTKYGFGWLNAAYGNRATGTGYIGSDKGGLTFGIRNFWQSYPAQLDIRNAHTDTATVNLWLWSPDAEAMDLRFYHDGLGEDSYPKQRDALDITYEDYELGFGRPVGVARTSEFQLIVEESTPDNETLISRSNAILHPPQLIASADYLESVHAFGDNWSLQNKYTSANIENQLDFYFDYYKKEVEQRHWYGFWNFGDVMHTYDEDRHVWRYDVGGFAWDNSELSTDLWLWYYFLRTGKADAFRLAEAMTRHTGEVDVHHIGPFAPLGSRHNVFHWGDSAKQLRISTVANRRFYYFLTADERVGDLMREQVNAYKTLQKIAPGRKLPAGSLQQDSHDPHVVNLGFGTDWGSVAAAWFTEWERARDKKIYEKLVNSMNSIAAQPHGFFTGGGSMEIETGKFLIDTKGSIVVSHLNAVFGLPEILSEIKFSIHNKAFEAAWLQYCTLYNASPQEQRTTLGQSLTKLNLKQGHARLTAYAAFIQNESALAKRAWKEFNSGEGGILYPSRELKNILPPLVLHPLIEIKDVSTNSIAQWGLAAIQCLAYAGKYLNT